MYIYICIIYFYSTHQQQSTPWPSGDGHPGSVTRSAAQPLDHDARSRPHGRRGQPGATRLTQEFQSSPNLLVLSREWMGMWEWHDYY